MGLKAFTPPSVSLTGDRNLREEEGNRPTVLYLPHLSLPCGRGLNPLPSPRHILRDGTALLQLASGLRHLVRDGTAWG